MKVDQLTTTRQGASSRFYLRKKDPLGGRLLSGTLLYRIHMFNRVTVRSKQVTTDRHTEEQPPCTPPRPHETIAPPRPSGGLRVAVRGMPCHEA